METRPLLAGLAPVTALVGIWTVSTSNISYLTAAYSVCDPELGLIHVRVGFVPGELWPCCVSLLTDDCKSRLEWSAKAEGLPPAWAYAAFVPALVMYGEGMRKSFWSRCDIRGWFNQRRANARRARRQAAQHPRAGTS